jgi:hypothetical protein
MSPKLSLLYRRSCLLWCTWLCAEQMLFFRPDDAHYATYCSFLCYCGCSIPRRRTHSLISSVKRRFAKVFSPCALSTKWHTCLPLVAFLASRFDVRPARVRIHLISFATHIFNARAKSGAYSASWVTPADRKLSHARIRRDCETMGMRL